MMNGLNGGFWTAAPYDVVAVCGEDCSACRQLRRQLERRQPRPIAVADGPVQQPSDYPPRYMQRAAPVPFLREQHSAGVFVVSGAAVEARQLLIRLGPISQRVPPQPFQSFSQLGWQAVLTYLPFAVFGSSWVPGLSGLLAGLVLLTVAAPAAGLLFGALVVAEAVARVGAVGLPAASALCSASVRVRFHSALAHAELAALAVPGGCATTGCPAANPALVCGVEVEAWVR